MPSTKTRVLAPPTTDGMGQQRADPARAREQIAARRAGERITQRLDEALAGERVTQRLDHARTTLLHAVVTAEWGWLAPISVTAAAGLLLLALAFAGARTQASWLGWTELLFWSGLLTLFVPIAVRLMAAGAPRRERIALVVVFGMGLFLVKMLQQPLAFAFHDEFLHWRTTSDILASGRLFSSHPILPISPLYPGLEVVTAALVNMSGLSIFGAGVIVLAVGRVVLVLALFLLYEQISASPRIAGLATLVYLINPKLIFFDAQFSYESLALPLITLVLYAMVARMPAQPVMYVGLTFAAQLALVAGVMTHHLTSYALVLFLVLWTATALGVRRIGNTREQAPTGMALLALVTNMIWLLYVAALVVQYLAPHIQGALRELLKLLAGELQRRELFRDFAGQVPPLWEREVGFAATVVILLGLPFGIYRVWRYYRRSAVALALALAALAYPASLAFRLTQAGGEASDRTAGSVFIAVAFVLAVALAWLLSLRTSSWRLRTLAAVLITVTFVGEVIVGAGPSWTRLPGPYLVAADARSIEPQGIGAAVWARAYLGPNNRIATDRTNRLLMASYGEQRPVTHARDNQDVSPLFFGLGYGTVQQQIVQQQQIRYVVVDTRLSDDLPRQGIYFEAPEPGALQHTTPIDPAALAKFDRLIGVSRVFDSGSIIIYELGEGVREP